MVVKPLDLIQQPWLKVGRGVRMFGKLARRRGADGTEEPPRLTDFPTKPANGLHPPSNNITLCHFMPAASLSFAVVFFSDRDYVPVVAGLKVDASKGTLLLQAQQPAVGRRVLHRHVARVSERKRPAKQPSTLHWLQNSFSAAASPGFKAGNFSNFPAFPTKTRSRVDGVDTDNNAGGNCRINESLSGRDAFDGLEMLKNPPMEATRSIQP